MIKSKAQFKSRDISAKKNDFVLNKMRCIQLVIDFIMQPNCILQTGYKTNILQLFSRLQRFICQWIIHESNVAYKRSASHFP